MYMHQQSSPLRGQIYQRFTKRLMDVVLSLVLIIIFGIPAIIIAILIKLSSEGPIFADVPERIGQHGRRFKMYKFRSMVQNAHIMLRTDPQLKELYEEYKKGSYKLQNDPRITTIGKFIRKHSLDELPQILNVLHGDMSLVGPRAYYPDELENQQNEYPHAKKLVNKVLSVKPGITGLWQVSGRSEIHFDERIIIDARYVERISLINDFIIIARTPLIMLTGKGAI
ncbi:galactosyl-1-phosphate transferase [Candidatus Roizmanbacteria bacterium CG_4_9_14_0_2_um_filter_39_13]|uniref:Galactosyl-1-phosphate transferase n=2 Tax=Candidatus Roizmaniibacteriota TaxID=1752723 RepID=A0A2M8EWB8_9BACT|nr:MAG: galactosyl-1-phosphate transferase [Candidatus Roizmanbacteria bacterium CG_4_10_14_0_2_um_filter_39_12]PJC30149.1 MAG: galactosyl-1-phosphate transferase [Candidatus Roizmanbacteria bacterium CG_4_9_14_0_2_um_filter_39_13]PJE61781.1 MAG: galactosyl-1-phosphate transferase [Candidatus Roizmanbacteria bacterium CG10_big_fil_rev_8_21_14_0_10_39_12]